MSDKFEPLKWDEVVSIDNSAKILIPHRTFTVSELVKAALELVKSTIPSAGWTVEKAKWAGEGVEADVLKYGAKGWQQGKVRLTIEFCPDEPEVEESTTSNQPEIPQPESPLDDLRQLLNQDNQQ
ncbi:KGK domain-containing protein [Argonema antarcticum]|uniref:KGK domain-containing protein n=1 Tax=Argonema antarcticum TaxID=2942763 RepID=UPI002012FEC7|nr:KGK domain-containing protein [Argonema antarcticum]MCL1473891.1 KGK family protein [Argonema antarcticum A004/B2]